MSIAKATIKYKTFSLLITFLIIFGGIYCYEKLGRLEDPEFTIKDAQVITAYPGATPKQVEKEVTEVLETAIQQLGQLDEITSESSQGLSIITVTIKDKYNKKTLPQVWDELRRKISDVQSALPPGVKPSIVYDDFGDVFGVLLSITGKGFTNDELRDYAKFLRKEILLVPDVAKITLWGVQQSQIFVDISRSRIQQLGITLNDIVTALSGQNRVVKSGAVKINKEYIRIQPSGEINSIDAISNLIIKSPKSDKIIYLKDIATITRGYETPAKNIMQFNGERGIAIGISTVSGGNVVNMGRALAAKINELKPQLPLGLNINYIYYQGEIVEKSVNSFVINLIQAIAIVIVILMIFMGLRSGLIIGSVLLITVCATIIFMYIYGINLQRISLGALIIALGMLVDNAIVVTEGIQIRLEQGEDKIKAAQLVVSQTMWPLLGATIIAILAFAAIGASQDSTGEFMRSLFQVMLISLGLSWVIAISITPLLCIMFIKVSKNKDHNVDPYQGWIFRVYKELLIKAIRFKSITVLIIIGLLISAIYGFGKLENSFFPDSTSPQFMLHVWLPQGTDIRTTNKVASDISKYLKTHKSVIENVSFIGGGAPRYTLVYSPEKTNSGYAFFLVKVNDWKKINSIANALQKYVTKNHIHAMMRIENIRLGPGGGFPLEARFSGDDPNQLRQLAAKAKAVMRVQGEAKTIRDNWRERVKIITPEVIETTMRRAGISRSHIANALQMTFSGRTVGLYREKDELVPVILRPPKNERSIDNISEIHVHSPRLNKSIPIRHVVKKFSTQYEDSIIHRTNKKRTITAQSEPRVGNVSVVLNRVKPHIDKIPLPIGYSMEWGGEYENSSDAQQGLIANLPITILIMFIITVALFNDFRQPIIIWLIVPLAVIGVVLGLTLTHESFGFMALLGFLSLTGMLIKNAIVLLDEIGIQRETKQAFPAIIYASLSRMRPVSMAAITTVLGMIPLLSDVFYFGMAITIMFGLAFATLLTLIIVPVFYCILFRVKYESS